MTSSQPHVTILVANLPAERDRRVIRESLTLESAGYQVTVIAPRGDKSLKVLPGSRNTRLRPYPVYVLGGGVLSFAVEFIWSFTWIALLLGKEVLSGRAQAVQVCNPPDVYWPLALAYRLLRRPWVFDHHDLSPEVYVTRSNGSPNRYVYGLLVFFERMTLRTASAVFATNESFRENAVRRGVPADRVTVVRNGPRRDEIAPVTAAPSSDGLHRLVYLGVLGPQDNVECAVLAAEELIKLRGRGDWRLTIAGDGETLPDLTKLVADRGLGDVVEFAGWLGTTEVDDLLRTATVAIQPDLPTKMNDLSTMAKTVEYLGRGVPVVAADLTETRRSAGDAAVYVPTGTPAEFAAAIHLLFDDPTKRASMRDVALSRFDEQLAWERQATRYLSTWNRLLKRTPVAIPRQRAAAEAATGAATEAVHQ
jgi:glycosyltransferase involved in cell wall biosynthesis